MKFYYAVVYALACLMVASSTYASTVVAKGGTDRNPLIVKSYSLEEFQKGIAEVTSIDRGRSFILHANENSLRMAFKNEHRTRGWHLCADFKVSNTSGVLVAEDSLKAGLNAKGVGGFKEKVFQKVLNLPENTENVLISYYRCSEKDFLPETIELAKKVVGIVAVTKKVLGLFPAKLFG